MKHCWNRKEKGIKTIGIAGSIRGSGVTHLSVALANYAASGLGEKTAYLELCGHGEISHWKEINQKGYFTDIKIDYYPDLKREQIPILMNCPYERLIMDFGDAYLNFREELLRCSRKIFLLNLNPWQKFAAEKMIRATEEERWGNIEPFYLSVNGQKDVKKKVEKKYAVEVMEVPLIPNPRHIPAENFPCMDSILGNPTARKKRKKTLIPIGRKK